MTVHKISILVILVNAVLVSGAQQTVNINIHDEMKKKNFIIINREVTLIDEPAYKGIHLSEDLEDGIAWLKTIDFTNGIIEFDTRGKDIRQHSFVGIAFHGNDTTTFESVYLRPFNFKATEEPFRSRVIQYVAKPTYTWQQLREFSPGQFEAAVPSSPDPDSWVHVRVVVENKSVAIFIDGSTTAQLIVSRRGTSSTGWVGFYVADTSGGDFANLSITPMP